MNRTWFVFNSTSYLLLDVKVKSFTIFLMSHCLPRKIDRPRKIVKSKFFIAFLPTINSVQKFMYFIAQTLILFISFNF